MKKLFGVMILATLPVACGTTTPNAPDLPATDPSAAQPSAFAGSGRLDPVPCTTVQRIDVSVVNQNKDQAFLSARPFGPPVVGSALPTFCGSPAWSVTPQGPGVSLTPGLSSNAMHQAVLGAPSGTYVVTVSYPGLSGATGSTTVSFK